MQESPPDGRANRHLMSGTTIRRAAQSAMRVLERSGVPDAYASAWLLSASAARLGIVGVGVAQRNGDRVMTAQDLETLDNYVNRRCRREPLQFIEGRVKFRAVDLSVRPPVLIPRPETEELVELALEAARRRIDSQPNCVPLRILDVGAGTGCIGLAMLAELPPGKATCVALEPNAVAHSLVLENSPWPRHVHTVHHVSIESFASAEPFDLIIANLPYIPTADLVGLEPEVREWEDHAALDGGADGLDVIRSLVRKLPALLKDGTSPVFLEVDPSAPLILAEWLGTADDVAGGLLNRCAGSEPNVGMQVDGAWNDLRGLMRFVRLQRREAPNDRT